MRRSKRLSLYIIAGFLFLSPFLTTVFPAQTAYAAQKDPSDQLERWLYYRGMRACFENPDWGKTHGVAGVDDQDGSRKKDEINKGEVWSSNPVYRNSKEGFGYIGPSLDGANDNDGRVNCSDADIWKNGSKAFGFPDVMSLICAMDDAMDLLGKGSKIEPSDPTNCTNSSKITFKGVEDSGSIWQQALTKALENPSASKYGGDGDRPSFKFSENEGPGYTHKSLWYLMGKKSLEVFCGGGASIESASVDNDVYKNSNKAVSVFVVQTDGTIKRSQSYPLDSGRTEGSRVKDVYYADSDNDNEASDRTCSDMARWTREGAKDYASYISSLIANGETPPGTGTTTTSDSSDEKEGTTCGIDGIGWIVCPVMTFMAKLNDGAFGFLNNFLEIKAGVISKAPMRVAWGIFRDIANVVFVIGFLLIVYAQLTGQGISNYGIKKLLPKLMLVAVLVNVSFFICQFAVDISNILGASIFDLFKGVNVGSVENAGWEKATSGILAVAVGAVAVISLLVLMFLAPASLLAFAVVILILIARQAFVILLIVVSPLAFATYLLPNTEQWFKKWWKAFAAMLMVFPIIALVFGASTLASNIISVVAADDKSYIDDNGTASTSKDNNDENMLKIIALGVLAVPLFAVPVLLKGSLAAVGSIGGKIAGLQSGANKMAGRGIKNGRIGEAKNAFDRARVERKANNRVGSGFRGRVNRRIDNSKFGRLIGGDRGATAAEAVREKAYNEAVSDASTSMRNDTVGEVADMAASGKYADGRIATETERAAAIDKTMASGGFSQRRKVLEGLASQKNSTSRELRNRAIKGAYAKGDQNIYGTGFGDQILAPASADGKQGTINGAEDLAQATVANAAAGNVQPENLVHSPSATQYLVETAMGTGEEHAGKNYTGAATAAEKLRTAAVSANSNQNTRAKMDPGIKEQLNGLGLPEEIPQAAPVAAQPPQQQGPSLRGGGTTTDSGLIIPKDTGGRDQF